MGQILRDSDDILTRECGAMQKSSRLWTFSRANEATMIRPTYVRCRRRI
jgi:hypothetical protein